MIYRAAKLKADTFDFRRTWKTSMKRQPQACILRIIELLRLEKPFKDHQVQLALFFSKKPARKGKKATAPQSTAISIPGNQVLCSALQQSSWGSLQRAEEDPFPPWQPYRAISVSGDWNWLWALLHQRLEVKYNPWLCGDGQQEPLKATELQEWQLCHGVTTATVLPTHQMGLPKPLRPPCHCQE